MGLGKGVGGILGGYRDQIAWLLKDDASFIKYNTLIEVLGRPRSPRRQVRHKGQGE
jgi:hypothetical protein